MSVVNNKLMENPWIITSVSSTGLTPVRRFFSLPVSYVGKNDHNVPVICMFKTQKCARSFNVTDWNAQTSTVMCFNEILDEQKVVLAKHTITLKNNVLFEPVEDLSDIIIPDYIEIDKADESLLTLAMLQYFQFLYVDTMNIENRVLTLNGIMINPLEYLKGEDENSEHREYLYHSYVRKLEDIL